VRAVVELASPADFDGGRLHQTDRSDRSEDSYSNTRTDWEDKSASLEGLVQSCCSALTWLAVPRLGICDFSSFSFSRRPGIRVVHEKLGIHESRQEASGDCRRLDGIRCHGRSRLNGDYTQTVMITV